MPGPSGKPAHSVLSFPICKMARCSPGAPGLLSSAGSPSTAPRLAWPARTRTRPPLASSGVTSWAPAAPNLLPGPSEHGGPHGDLALEPLTSVHAGRQTGGDRQRLGREEQTPAPLLLGAGGSAKLYLEQNGDNKHVEGRGAGCTRRPQPSAGHRWGVEATKTQISRSWPG